MAPAAVDVLPAMAPGGLLPGKMPGSEYYSRGLRARFQLDALKPATQPAPYKPTQYANIGYDVDKEAFERREAASLANPDRPTTVPDGFPTELTGPLCWTSDSFPDEEEYIYRLTDTDMKEAEQALEYFKQQGLDGHEVTRETFPLPTLGKRLEAARDDVYLGRGFVIVRGLDPDAYPVEDLTILYLGISSYIAEQRGRQDRRGSMLMHVILRADADRDPILSEDKPFHCDTVTDCLCLFTQNLAKVGGRSILASAYTVYNELAATRPDLIHVLAKPDWPFDTFGRSPPYYLRAPLYHHDGKIIMSFSRRLLVGHPPFDTRTAGIPGLTEQQAEALDALHFIARKHEIKPRMEKGDLRLINNMAILHRREAFENAPDTARHLVRVWLHNPQMCWPLPRDLRLAWARIFEDEEVDRMWDIVPPRHPDTGRVLRVAGSCD